MSYGFIFWKKKHFQHNLHFPCDFSAVMRLHEICIIYYMRNTWKRLKYRILKVLFLYMMKTRIAASGMKTDSWSDEY